MSDGSLMASVIEIYSNEIKCDFMKSSFLVLVKKFNKFI